MWIIVLVFFVCAISETQYINILIVQQKKKEASREKDDRYRDASLLKFVLKVSWEAREGGEGERDIRQGGSLINDGLKGGYHLPPSRLQSF